MNSDTVDKPGTSTSGYRNRESGTNENENQSKDELNEDDIDDSQELSARIEDGTYSATVVYYNPNTGTRSSYTLEVVVEGNELQEIDFPNGGYMDKDHYDGGAEFEGNSVTITSDQGYEYTVTIDD